jgi:carbamoyl-phosphate synthase large subunit
VACLVVNKVAEGRPHIVDMIKNDEFDLIINTTEGKQAILDSRSIRAAALQHKVSYTTTISGAEAAVLSLRQPDELNVNSLQELHR